MGALGRDVAALSRALWPDGPRPHLVGHSMGGLVARRAVLDSPAAFASVTLMSSGPAAVPEHQRPALEVLRELLPHTELADIWEAKSALDESRGIIPPPAEILEFLHRRWLRNSPAGLSSKAEILLNEPDRTAQLRACDIPTLVLCGADDDVWPPQWQEAMSQRLGGSYRQLAGVGHSPACDAPAETAASLLSFWGMADRLSG